MKNITVEMCENWIKDEFARIPENGGIAVGCFWDMVEKAGMWKRGLYGSTMSVALENLTRVAIIRNEQGDPLYSVFKLKQGKTVPEHELNPMCFRCKRWKVNCTGETTKSCIDCMYREK